MSAFIERLKENQSMSAPPKTELAKVPETAGGLDPVIVAGVTFGKELHAGHLFLLGFADILKSSVGSENPLVIINNNTGPRPAGALSTLARTTGLDLETTAKLLDGGYFNPKKIVEAYRARAEGEEVLKALEVVDSGKFDVFAEIANIVDEKLTQAGFNAKIISESRALAEAVKIIEEVNSNWAGSGFTILETEKGVKVLQKNGFLTSTGKGLSSFIHIANQIRKEGRQPLLVFVDGSPDSADTATCFSALKNFGKGAQIPGTAVSFEGQIASGTKGEALTLSQILSRFKEKCPEGSVLDTIKFMVLTKPVLINSIQKPSVTWATFDFKDNNALIEALVNSYTELQTFKENVKKVVLSLNSKVGTETVSDNEKVAKDIQFLPLKLAGLKKDDSEKILGSAKSVKVLKDKDDIMAALLFQGYPQNEAEAKTQEYLAGPRGLGLRSNYYFSMLTGFLKTASHLRNVTPDVAQNLTESIRVSMQKLGYEI